MARAKSLEEIIRVLTDFLEAEPSVELAILYGSYASGRVGPESDVDVAVAFAHPLSFQEKLDWVAKLSSVVKREVDLVDLRTANGPILGQILSRGKILVRRKSALLGQLMVRLVDYQTDFKPLRDRIQAERRKRVFWNGTG